MTDYENIIKNGKTDNMINFLTNNSGYERTVMHYIINYTNRVDMAEAVFPFYKNTYTYVEVCTRFLDEPDYHIDFDIKDVSPEIKKWILTHSDVFLKPFKIIRMSRNHDFIINEEVINIRNN